MTGQLYRYNALAQTWESPGRSAIPNVPSFVRPDSVVVDGVEYGAVRYEDLYVTNDTIAQTLSRLTTAAVITFPTGDFFADDFDTGYITCINVDNTKPIKGIWGSGPGDYTHTEDGTYFGINANTSTHAADQNNVPYVMKAANCGAQSYGQFAVLGTEQGHLYSCFSVYQPSGLVTVTDVLVSGWAGNSNVPPGEMAGFTIIDQASTHFPHVITRVEGDCRRPDGSRTGTAPLGGQNLVGATFVQCYGHHAVASQVGFFQCRDVTTYDCRSEYNGTGSSGLSGQGINHEQTDGIVHYRPVVIVDHSNGNTGVHFTHSNYGGTSAYAPGDLTIIDPTFNSISGLSANTLYINSWDPFVSSNTAEPDVTVDGDPITFNWNHS
jgi:hypothetical protein